MQKKSLLALLLALMMILSGCALITVDEEKDAARVIVDVKGKTVNKQTITASVQNQITQNQYYNQLASMLNMAANYPTDTATVTAQVISMYENNLVALEKAAELGLDQLTEEEAADAEAQGKENYNAFLQNVASTYLKDSGLEGDELNAAAEKYAVENKILTVDGRGTLEDFVKTARDSKAVEKLQAYMIKDVEVTEEEIEKDFNEKVEASKAEVESNPDLYGYNRMNGATAYYVPAGYRMVKHILVAVDSSDAAVTSEKEQALTDAQAALTEAQTALTSAAEDADKSALRAAVETAQAAVDAAQAAHDEAEAAGKANAKAKADEVRALAAAEGADFDALVKEYSTDSGMPAEGYAIREGFKYFMSEFVDGAMALEKPGDVSEPVETSYGYHIIQYVSDLQEGPVELDTVRESISSALLTTKQNTVQNDMLAQWITELGAKTYPERMN